LNIFSYKNKTEPQITARRIKDNKKNNGLIKPNAILFAVISSPDKNSSY
jgi:hypothetical protein